MSRGFSKVTSLLLVCLLLFTFVNFTIKHITYIQLVTDELEHDAQLSPQDLYCPLLTFIPVKTNVLIKPWVLITCSFVEESIISVFINGALIWFLGRYLETLWGGREYAKFVFFVIIVTNVSIVVFYFMKSLFIEEFVSPVIYDSTAIVMGLIVAIKQRIPNHYLLFFNSNIRVKLSSLPFMAICLFSILSFVNQAFVVSLDLSFFGLLTSWIYLRFLKENAGEKEMSLLPLTTSQNMSSNIRTSGDRTAEFSFHTFFPYPVSIVVKFLTLIAFKVLVWCFILDEENFEVMDETSLPDDIHTFKSNFFSLSSLKGVADNGIPTVSSKLHLFANWFSPKETQLESVDINKRRKLALKELDKRSPLK